MSNDYDPDDTDDRRLIRDAKEEAFHARRQLRREQPEPSLAAKRDLAAALEDYRDQLLDYRDDNALKTDWDDRDVDVDVLPSLLSETTSVTKSLNRRGAPSTTQQVPKVAKTSAASLIRIGKELDKIAAELGFAASTKGITPGDEATMDDLRGLLKARGQAEALSHLPDGEATDVTPPGGGGE